MADRKRVEDLYVVATGVGPIHFDFGDGEGENWRTITPDVTGVWSEAECREFIEEYGCLPPRKDKQDGERHWVERVNEAIEEDGVAYDSYSPMMNYYYALPGYDGEDAERDQAILLGSSAAVCLVEIGDEYALALTGGGMDLSLHICYAYMLLGYLPPLHFAKASAFYTSIGEDDAWVLEGCLRTCNVVEVRAAYTREQLGELKEGRFAAR